MRIRYDADVDALYIRFAEAPIEDSAETDHGLIVDTDAQGRVVGLEVLDASRFMPNPKSIDVSLGERRYRLTKDAPPELVTAGK